MPVSKSIEKPPLSLNQAKNFDTEKAAELPKSLT
jgi:hypothetical protein